MSDFQALLDECAMLADFVDQAEAQIKPYKEALANARCAVQAQMEVIGISSAKSSSGHGVALVNSASAKIVDADAFFDFVFEQGDSDFLQKRVSTEAVQQYLNEHNALPPGVEFTTVNTLRFTRAKH